MGKVKNGIQLNYFFSANFFLFGNLHKIILTQLSVVLKMFEVEIKNIKNEMNMTSIFQKLFGSRFLSIISLVVLTNTVNAQWVMVDSSGIPKSFISDEKYIYTGFRGGSSHPAVIRSSDTGLTWENKSNGLSDGSMYYDVNSFCTVGNNILAGTSYGIFISSDYGDSWIRTNFDQSHGAVHALLAEDSIIFAGSVAHEGLFEQGGIFSSIDYGQTWARSDSGIMCPTCGVYPSVYALARSGSTIFAGTSQGVYLSNDKGKIWMWDSLGPAISFAVIDSAIFVGYFSSSFISRSTNMGISWTRCETGLPDNGIQYLAANNKNLLGGSIFEGIYFSSDMGDHWKPVNDGLGTGDSSSALDDISSIGLIDNYIFAGSIGLWRRPLAEITSVESNPTLPEGFELKQNYPNPFNSSTVITYGLSTISDVSLIVYDVLGRKVQTLVNEVKQAGTYSVSFDASNLASGIYFYSITAGKFHLTKKMLIIR